MRDVRAALLCVVVTGCTYDWSRDWASGPDDASPDARGDAMVDVQDASMDAFQDGATDVATTADVAGEAPLPACNMSQGATVQQARTAALNCTGVTPNPCQITVTDECGCKVVVATNNQAEAQYVTAIQMLLKECIPSCPSGCGSTSLGVCIIGDAGSSMLACYQ
jgi:hypothetical protein